MELEYMRKTDFYEALLSETIAYAEVDVESGHIMKATGVWETYGIESREERADFDKVVQKQVSLVVYPEDEEEYRSHLNLRYMKEMYKKGVPTMELCFRHYAALLDEAGAPCIPGLVYGKYVCPSVFEKH